MSKVPTLIMTIGLPGSGKSSYAAELEKEGYVVCSSDAIREEICNDINCQDKNVDVFNILHSRIKEHLKNGQNVVYDACNIASKRRRAFLMQLNKIKCVKKCVVIATPYTLCVFNNENRERTIPQEVIDRMYKCWQPPHWFEGWDDIDIAINSCSLIPESAVNPLMSYNQKNSHHTLTLGLHLTKAMEIARDKKWGPEVEIAAFLHDIGKPFTQTFVNGKGETTKDAHYYQHHCVSAYNAMFYLTNKKFADCRIDILAAISYHMMPYFWEKDERYGEKTRDKYKKLWGEHLYEIIMKLHAADLAAH